MIFQVIVYAILIIALVCTSTFVIALANMRSSKKNDVDVFLAEKRKCKFKAYDEIVEKCKEKCASGEVHYFSYEDVEDIIGELESTFYERKIFEE